MDCGGPEVGFFEEVDRRYPELKRLREVGNITDEEFDERLHAEAPYRSAKVG